jgi:hypothetical protein
MKINDRVKFMISQDDSDYATNCFGVEPQNNWFDVQFYAEEIEGIIIWNKGLLLAQQVYKGRQGIEMRGKVFDVSRNGINKRLDEIKTQIEKYNIKERNFLGDDEELTLNSFFEITKV